MEQKKNGIYTTHDGRLPLCKSILLGRRNGASIPKPVTGFLGVRGDLNDCASSTYEDEDVVVVVADDDVELLVSGASVVGLLVAAAAAVSASNITFGLLLVSHWDISLGKLCSLLFDREEKS